MMKRKDKKQEKLNALRKRNLPSSPHVPLVDKCSENELKILKEIAIMKKLRHPHVVRLLEVIDDHLAKDIYLGKCARDHYLRTVVACARVIRPTYSVATQTVSM